MGSGESRGIKVASLIGWLALAGVILAAGPAPRENHSFDIQAAGRQVCTNGAIFVGETIAPSSLNIVQTSEVWDSAGTTLLATGDSHTFTTVGETFTFTVFGSFTAGATVALVVTNVPGSSAPLGGTEGDVATETVGDCTLPVAPTLPVWGLTLLALALVGGGRALLARGARDRSPAAMG